MQKFSQNSSSQNEKTTVCDSFYMDSFQVNGGCGSRKASFVSDSFSSRNFEEDSAFERLNALSSDINLFTMISSAELLAKFDKEDPAIVSAWLEHYLEQVQFTDRKTAKVISFITNMYHYPHIRKLPPELIAQLPGLNETPPALPESSQPDLDSLINASSDEWSSTTTVNEPQSLSSLEDTPSLHSNLLNESVGKSKPLKTAPSLYEKQSIVESADKKKHKNQKSNPVGTHDMFLAPSKISGRLFKTIIEQKDFQEFLKSKKHYKQYLSTADLL